MYSVKTETGVTIGELHEEYVFEAREGDKFLLGTFAWQITDIGKDAVTVRESSLGGAKPPFWKDEIKGRRLETGLIFGEIFRKLAGAAEDEDLWQELAALGLDEPAVRYAHQLIKHQLGVTGVLPDDKTILIEHYKDETGIQQMLVHSVFGKPVNEPLAILLAEAAKRIMNININYLSDDDGILLFPYEDHQMPEGLLSLISPETALTVLGAALPVTARFNMSFRYNAARALMMGVRKTGRQPLWIQRMRSAEMLDSIINNSMHPLIRETKRECLEDYWDMQGLEMILQRIKTGEIRVCEMRLLTPSPMSHALRYQAEASMMYDYTPTTSGVIASVEEALSRTELIAPAPEQLQKINDESHSKRPENAEQLHTFLMIEGELTPGELELPLAWFESLEEKGQALYIEPGLWIAAEQAEEYDAALNGRVLGIRARIVRRLLRYKGAQTAQLLAERYFFSEEEAEAVLKSLVKSGEAIEFEGLYYHSKQFDKARKETVKQRRTQIKTLPAERYAALLAGRLLTNGTAAMRMEDALKSLCGYCYTPELWENVIFPNRVDNYKPELLDKLLAEGGFSWRMEGDGALSFYAYEDLDWDGEPLGVGAELEGNEKLLYEALKKNGASFINRLSSLLNGASPYEPLLALAEKGIACADSFVPVRNLINKTKIDTAPIRQKIKSRVTALTAGRWELVRPLKELTIQQQLERAFDRYVILSKETAQGINWAEAIRVLRLWEYTGQVRRGYFIEGLSGMQFIREKDFAGAAFALNQQDTSIIWTSAIDPLQPWGKLLAHRQDKAFMNVAGTVTALRGGGVAAVFERQGKSLTVYDLDSMEAVLSAFVKDFRQKRLYPSLKRIILKQYPKEAEEALTKAGFTIEMQDMVLYRT
jgi:ATP-dependent Lhr-like helicase